MKMKKEYLNYIYFIILAMFLSGCVAFQPFPHSVRAGDTITLAIGSVDGANRLNTTVEYYPDSDPLNPVDLTPGVRSVLRLFPDKTSHAYWNRGGVGGTDNIHYLTTTLSKHGPWQSVVVVDLPITIPAGTGTIKVSLGPDVVYPETLKKVDDVAIAMEILDDGAGGAAQGDAHDFEYHQTSFSTNSTVGDLVELEQARQVVLRVLPNFFANYIPVAAAEYELTVPIIDQSLNDVTDQVINTDIVVVLDDQPNFIKNQTSLMWSRSGATIKVSVISASGGQDPGNIRFSVLLSNLDLVVTNGWQISESVSLNSITYFDVNGEVMGGPMPQVIVQ